MTTKPQRQAVARALAALNDEGLFDSTISIGRICLVAGVSFDEFREAVAFRRNPGATGTLSRPTRATAAPLDHGTTTIRWCPRCKTDKPLSEFNARNRDSGRAKAYCRDCSKAYQRDRYLTLKKQNALAVGEFVLAAADEWTGHDCPDCGKPFVAGDLVHLTGVLTHVGCVRQAVPLIDLLAKGDPHHVDRVSPIAETRVYRRSGCDECGVGPDDECLDDCPTVSA